MNVIDCIILAGIGILTVFAILFALSILIRLISFTVHLQTSWKRHAKVSLAGHGSISLPSTPNTSCGICKQYQVDDRTAAMVMAIVADETKLPLNEITFISIREVRPREENEI